MIRCQNNGLVYYKFELFEDYPELVHGVFTRHGGVSRPPFDGLNLAFVPDEDEEDVRMNLKKASDVLGIGMPAFAGQVHGDQALVVRVEDGYRPGRRADVKSGYDALITVDAGLPLLTKLADCQGAILYEPETGVLSVVHSGWRGSVKNILGKTVRRMAEEFRAVPEKTLAAIGPSLGPCCAEFRNFRTELPEHFWDFRDGDYFDFWSISRMQLERAGLRTENIQVSGVCTRCGNGDFYSYRREKITGRFGLMAGLREE